jgi:tripartite-type tricarboxylate transporter receptor subunit TctC
MLMKKSLALVAALALSAAFTAPVAAQSNYPSQNVKIVVPFAAGSLTDMLARILSDKLSPVWHQSIIVENQPGIAGTAATAKAAPDGYTFLLVSNGHTVIKTITPNLSFDPLADFVGVTKLASMPMIMIAPPKEGNSLAAVIKRAQENPGKLSYASAGLNSTAYIAGELLKKTKNLDIVHVPYKGTPPAQTSIMRGDTDFFFSPASVSDELILTGKVAALAVTGKTRVGSLPKVPTFAEAGMPEFQYDAWFGLLAPAGTPKAIRDKVSQDIAKVLASPDVRDRLAKQGTVVASSTPEEFDAVLKSDTELYTRVLGGPAK